MICSIADVNRHLREDAATFIRETEEAYDQQMTAIAAHIRDHADTCPVVLISGPSGSGKTTSALILEKKLDALVMRELYTKYKTAPSEEEREKARREYLDKRAVPDNFRW